MKRLIVLMPLACLAACADFALPFEVAGAVLGGGGLVEIFDYKKGSYNRWKEYPPVSANGTIPKDGALEDATVEYLDFNAKRAPAVQLIFADGFEVNSDVLTYDIVEEHTTSGGTSPAGNPGFRTEGLSFYWNENSGDSHWSVYVCGRSTLQTESPVIATADGQTRFACPLKYADLLALFGEPDNIHRQHAITKR